MDSLSKLLRRNAYHHILFGYVIGVRNNLPGMSVQNAIGQFVKHFELDKDTNPETLRLTFIRMEQEFYQHIRQEHGKQKTEVGNGTKEN